MIVWVLQIYTFNYLSYVVDVCFDVFKDFYDLCLFNIFDQIVVGIVSTCFWLKNYKKQCFALQHDRCAVLLRRIVAQITEKSLNAQQRSLHDCKIPRKNCESWDTNWVFRLSLRLSTQILEIETKQAYKIFWDRSLSLKINKHEVKSTSFFTLVALCLKTSD